MFGPPPTDEEKRIAERTAFVARFIVLREGRSSRAHRRIEALEWTVNASVDDVYVLFREAFVANGDRMSGVDKDLNRALDHARRSSQHFVDPYLERATTTFFDALKDYMRSNELLFGADMEEVPRSGGWKMPKPEKKKTAS